MASTAQGRRDRNAGRLLREWRLDRGLSPEALSWELRRAKLETVSGRQIRRIEDEGIIPTPRVMFALATFYGTSPSQVWGGGPRRLAVAA
jgi:transcriptional regulator with XRE-family HTH domain